MATGGGKPGTRVSWTRGHVVRGVLVETRTIGHLVPALTKLGPALLRKLQIILLGRAGLVSWSYRRGGEAKKGNGKPVNAEQMNKPAAIAPELCHCSFASQIFRLKQTVKDDCSTAG